MLQYQTIYPATLQLLKDLQTLDLLKECRLVGGTALALQLGHRRSVDLDFFGTVPETPDELQDCLRENHQVTVVKESKNIHIYLIDGVKVDIVNYKYDWIDTPVEDDGIRLAGVKDIAAMKVAAIIGRGTKKDFIDLYFLLKQFGLTQAGAVPGLILVSVASSGMGYYVCKGYFDTLPIALDEAARIDGASRARIFLELTMPLSKPIIIYTALVAFMAPWCDFVMASYIAFGHDKSYNVAVGLQRWVWTNDYQGYFTRFCAGGILVAIPVTLLFMFLQRYYVEGVTGGAVKG